MSLHAKPILGITAMLATLLPVTAVSADWQTEVDQRAQSVNDRVIKLRHHFHAYPELSNQEFKTAEKIAAELTALGSDEVHTGVAGTGVVGILKGSQPGPTVALRALGNSPTPRGAR